MASKAQVNGMRGVYLVAAELSRLGLIASPTSRSAVGADILVTDAACQRAWSVQVKTNGRNNAFWLIGKVADKTVSKSHVYVLVNVKKSNKDGEVIEYFVVPSKALASRTHSEGNWPSVYKKDIEKYRNNWSVFGPADEAG